MNKEKINILFVFVFFSVVILLQNVNDLFIHFTFKTKKYQIKTIESYHHHVSIPHQLCVVSTRIVTEKQREICLFHTLTH